MKKYLLIFSVLVLFVTIACVKEPLAMYYDLGVVEVISDSTSVNFNVPDPDTNGWHQWEGGEGTNTFTITLKEKAKKDVVINEVVWTFYTLDGGYVAQRGVDYIPPIKIDAGKEHELTLTIKVDEGIADDLDDATGDANDFYGEGTIEFDVRGYDVERGNEVNTIPSYTPITVQR
ncbi:hypothetical protein BXT86_05605 [candidate division WOR-3 bacterium 4484_100]|uniref:CARDB domain-containing protein n=1 Tax=candidate division WOR-3 bacterium 4484_100 TaxID=1936077 RepID=A0A1V4QE23_UNCW3|nr:MAG: hypothetical protein BXT86_05605 [candidate division WOR-3 bacterium 4484_100]